MQLKKYLLFGCLYLACLHTYGQVIVGAVDINAVDSIQVVEVLVDRRGIRKSVEVSLDFGQKDNDLFGVIGARNEDQRIMNPLTGKKMLFRSTAAVLNFMTKNNWEHYDTVIPGPGGNHGFYFYFRRAAKNE